jgi:hypothetical protein
MEVRMKRSGILAHTWLLTFLVAGLVLTGPGRVLAAEPAGGPPGGLTIGGGVPGEHDQIATVGGKRTLWFFDGGTAAICVTIRPYTGVLHVEVLRPFAASPITRDFFSKFDQTLCVDNVVSVTAECTSEFEDCEFDSRIDLIGPVQISEQPTP